MRVSYNVLNKRIMFTVFVLLCIFICAYCDERICFCCDGVSNDSELKSEIQVQSPMDVSVVVIIKDSIDRIVKCKLIESYGTINVANGEYRIVFYFGTEWSEQKKIYGLNGGFLKNESVLEDVISLHNDTITFELD